MKRSILALAAALGALALFLPVGAGAGAPPAIAFTPTTLPGSYDFGTLAPGTSVSQTFTLTNAGGSATGALTITLTGSGAFTKTADTCSATSIGPQKTCTVTVRYSPVGEGANDVATLFAEGKKTGALTSLVLVGKSAVLTADISLSIAGQIVTVSNAGPAAATVTVLLECPGSALLGEALTPKWIIDGGPPGDLFATSINPIPSGGALTLQADCFSPDDPGYAEVFSSSLPDPDSTPNNAVTTEDDYVVVP